MAGEADSHPSGKILADGVQFHWGTFVLKAAKDTFSGGLGGAACVLAGQPFDTVKVKMQTFPNLHSSITTSLRRTLVKEGVKGLYAGSAASFVANIGENASLFFFYGRCQQVVRSVCGGKDSEKLTVKQNATSGALAAVFSSVIVCPLELIKCRRQAQFELLVYQRRGVAKQSQWDIARQLVQAEGVQGLYRGLTSTWVREVPGYFCFFGGYDLVLSLLAPENGDANPATVVFAGGVGGACFWLASFPADVVKSRQQVDAGGTQSVNFLKGFSQIWQAEGFRGLYRGLLPTVIRAFPANGALFLAYEMSKKMLS